MKTKRKRAALYSTELERIVRDNERAWREKNAKIQQEYGLQRDAAHNDPAEAMQRPMELTSMAQQQYVRAKTPLTLDEWQELKSRQRREREDNSKRSTEIHSVRIAIGAKLDAQTVEIAETLACMSPVERATFHANLNARVQNSRTELNASKGNALSLAIKRRQTESALVIRAHDKYEREHKV
jgi:hypothetical protein